MHEAGPPLECGSVIRERFVLEEVIGTGGMGQVFRALDRRREEAQDRQPYVAIKVLAGEFRHHPDALRALQREARKAQKLAHPNIGSVFDFDRDGSNVYLVMELLQGKPLNEEIKAHSGTGLGLDRALHLIEELGIALSHAHSRGIVHADFKPSNVFLTNDGEVKVIDFGIARAGRTGAGAQDASQTVFDAGKLGAATLAYASPEQLLGVAEPDERDDVYSLGVVAYELFAGVHPFERRSALEAQLQEMKVAPVPALDETRNEALRRALSFRRELRPASVNDFVTSLGLEPVVRPVATASPVHGASEEPTRFAATGRPSGQRPKHAMFVAAGVAAVLAVGGGTVYAYRARQAQAREQEREQEQRLAAEARLEQERAAHEAADRARRDAEARAAAEAEARAETERQRVAAEEQAERDRLARERADQQAAARRTERKRDPAGSAEAGPSRPALKEGAFYRWEDASGEVHYGTHVPTEYADKAVPVAPAD